ncbi:MAG: PRC-barrel domain-containing protein [Elusimicrobia bacterium]|nr:PRC-barrel domain-containing protein [Elusimicrobiota bacterium]
MPKDAPQAWNVSDILGFEVYDEKGEKLGLLSDVTVTGSNDVWTVKSQYDEILIPALKTVVREVNLSRKKIFVTLPQGYEEIYKTISRDESAEYNGYTVYED